MGDVVAHREYSSEGKIDPAGIDMGPFRAEVNAMVNTNKTGIAPAPTNPAPEDTTMTMTKEQNDALAAVYEQAGRWHPVRQVFQRVFYNTQDGKLWLRAGLADMWNEIVWDGFVNPVDIIDKKIDPDNAPADTPVENLARRGSLISYVLATYREATLSRRNTDEILKILKAGK